MLTCVPPTLFVIYVDKMIVKWNQFDTRGIILSTGTKIITLSFGDDRVIIADSEDNLQRDC
jgi:hypothetical protein